MPDDFNDPPGGRGDILAAATDLFSEAGFDAVSMSAIARRAGVSKANVFHHFGSKEDLYLEVMRSACKLFSRAGVEDSRAEADFGDRLKVLLQHDIELMKQHSDRAQLIMREVLESGECRGRALAGEVFADQFDETVAEFERARRDGNCRDDVPAELAATMMIACKVFLFQSGNVLRHLPGVDFVDDPERYAGFVGRVLFEGLRPPRGAVSRGNE